MLTRKAKHIAVEAAHFSTELRAQLQFAADPFTAVLLLVKRDHGSEPQTAQSSQAKGSVISRVESGDEQNAEARKRSGC
jgi:hypothetical protein